MQEDTATVQGFLLPRGPAACVPQGATAGTDSCNRVCTGKAWLGRKATTNIDFCLKSLFSQQEGYQPDWAVLSPGCSKATDVPLVVEGWVVCSASVLSRFLEDRRDPSALRSVKERELHLCIGSGKSFPAELPAGWCRLRSHKRSLCSPLSTEGYCQDLVGSSPLLAGMKCVMAEVDHPTGAACIPCANNSPLESTEPQLHLVTQLS